MGVSRSIRSSDVISKAANSFSRESPANLSATESDASSFPIDAGRELTGAALNSWNDALSVGVRVSAASA